jgi:hypothetical protein
MSSLPFTNFRFPNQSVFIASSASASRSVNPPIPKSSATNVHG